MNESTDFGLWQIVFINSLIFLFLAFSFFQPRTKWDWRTFGAFSAFIIALFTEMYGFPLTLYLLSGWLSSRFPEINWFSHNSNHFFQTMLGWKGNPHFGPLHIVSDLLVLIGLILLAASWKILYRAQRNFQIACTGPYSFIRHPQYTAFIVIMIGFLIQWPTLPTLLMFPVLIWLYARLARREEQESLAQYGDAYASYAERTPRFFPRLQLGTSISN
jgi:protein-S-isoprenylcysteine O-methyltransferase Ste14